MPLAVNTIEFPEQYEVKSGETLTMLGKEFTVAVVVDDFLHPLPSVTISE